MLQKDICMLQKDLKANVKNCHYPKDEYVETIKQELRDKLLLNEKLHQNVRDIEETYIEKVSRLECHIHKLSLQKNQLEDKLNNNTKPSIERENLQSCCNSINFPNEITLPNKHLINNHNQKVYKFMSAFCNLIYMLTLYKQCILQSDKTSDVNKLSDKNSTISILYSDSSQIMQDVEDIIKAIFKMNKIFLGFYSSLTNIATVLQPKDYELELHNLCCFFTKLAQELKLNLNVLKEKNISNKKKKPAEEDLLIDLNENIEITSNNGLILSQFSIIFQNVSQKISSLHKKPEQNIDVILACIQEVFDQIPNFDSHTNSSGDQTMNITSEIPMKPHDLEALSRAILELSHNLSKSLESGEIDSCNNEINYETYVIPGKDSKNGYADIISTHVAQLIAQIYDPYLMPFTYEDDDTGDNSKSIQKLLSHERDKVKEVYDAKLEKVRETLLESQGLSRAYLNEMFAMSQRFADMKNVIQSKEALLNTHLSEIKRLNEELGTTRLNYEDQLSAMSDHVCLLNEQLNIFKEEMILNAARGRGGIHIEE